MNTSIIEALPDRLPGRIVPALERAMTTLPTLWGRLRMGLENGREKLFDAICEAENLDPSILVEVREIGQLATAQEQLTFLRMLLSAWPNASQSDLAGFGLQLSRDIEQERPSRYALAEASRHLRRTMRFLPSISEVLDAIAAADKPMKSVLRTLDQIPAALERARKDIEGSR